MSSAPKPSLRHEEIPIADLTRKLAENWWVFLVRGILVLVFGGFALYLDTAVSNFILRAIALVSLVVALAFYLFCSGIVELGAYLRRPGSGKRSLFLLVDATLGFLMCAFTLYLPGVTAESVPRVVAIYAILLGTLEVAIGFRLHSDFRGRWIVFAAGAAMLLIGITLLSFSTYDPVRLVHELAAAAFCIGGLSIWTAWEFRRQGARFSPPITQGYVGTR